MVNFFSYLQHTKPYLVKTPKNVHFGLLETLIKEKVTGSNQSRQYLQVMKSAIEATFYLAQIEQKRIYNDKYLPHTSLTS